MFNELRNSKSITERIIKMYRIMGKYKGLTEELDTADTLREAEYLRAEYSMAYKGTYTIWIEETR